MEPLLDVHAVAAIMRLHHKKVQRLARTGVLPCIKVGAVYRFRVEALEKWMSEHEVSERVTTQDNAQVGRAGLGVQVSGRLANYAAKDLAGKRVLFLGHSESGITELSVLPE